MIIYFYKNTGLNFMNILFLYLILLQFTFNLPIHFVDWFQKWCVKSFLVVLYWRKSQHFCTQSRQNTMKEQRQVRNKFLGSLFWPFSPYIFPENVPFWKYSFIKDVLNSFFSKTFIQNFCSPVKVKTSVRFGAQSLNEQKTQEWMRGEEEGGRDGYNGCWAE